MKTLITISLVLILSGCSLSGSDNTAEIINNDDQIVTPSQPNNNEPDDVADDEEIKPTVKTSKKIDLSNNGLNNVPMDIFENKDAEELDLSGNKLTGAIPAEIRQLKNLIILDLSDNLLSGVPAEVGQLTKLEILDLSNNELTGLPNELANLKNLKTLNLSGNDYSRTDLDLIRPGLPSTVNIITE